MRQNGAARGIGMDSLQRRSVRAGGRTVPPGSQKNAACAEFGSFQSVRLALVNRWAAWIARLGRNPRRQPSAARL